MMTTQDSAHNPQGKASLFDEVYACLMCADPVQKCALVKRLFEQFDQFDCERVAVDVPRLEVPGIPTKPNLVEPHQMKKRGIGSVEGRIALLHALAHIEFNAINLALDAVYRFRHMPAPYQHDWLRVASDESRHFLMIAHRLESLDSFYGAYDAHAGLWNMAVKTDHDVLVRMALVPRVLEARGLDVAPPMIKKLRHANDHASADILDIIYHDEIEHVKIGNHWYLYCCQQKDLEPTELFRKLLREHSRGVLRGPYNQIARVQAGFTEDELEALVLIEKEFTEFGESQA